METSPSTGYSADEAVVVDFGFDYTLADIPVDKLTTNAYNLRQVPLLADKVDDYATAMSRGAQFPPIVVHEEQGMFVIDSGNHRYEASRRVGKTSMSAFVLQVDLTSDDEVQLLDMLRAKTNLTHGTALSIAERLQFAVDLVAHRGQNKEKTAQSLNLTTTQIDTAIAEQAANDKIHKYGFEARAFPNLTWKRSFINANAGPAGRKVLFDIVAKYTGDNIPQGARKMSYQQWSKFLKEFVAAPSETEQDTLVKELKADLHAGKAPRTGGNAQVTAKWKAASAVGVFRAMTPVDIDSVRKSITANEQANEFLTRTFDGLRHAEDLYNAIARDHGLNEIQVARV